MDEFEAMLESAKVPPKPKRESARRPSSKHKNKHHKVTRIQKSWLEQMLDEHESIWHDDDWYEGMNDD